MTERQALVKAMLAEPDDDLPRLVFADWLDDHGESERAAFTRLQVEAMRQTGDDRERLLGEAAAILDRRYDDWVGPVSRFIPTDYVWQQSPRHIALRSYPFYRGVLSVLEIDESEFIRPEVQEQLTAWGADNGIETLTLSPVQSARATWSALGTMAGILVNTLRGKYIGREPPVTQPAASPVLASVACLSVTGHSAGDMNLRALSRSPHVGLLSRLILSNPLCTDAGLNALAHAQTLPNLLALILNTGRTRVRFTADGVLKMLASDRLPRLGSLALGGNGLAGFDLDRLLNHPAAGRLTQLQLGASDAIQSVSQSRQLTRLESFELSGSQIVVTNEGVAEFLRNPSLTGLREFVIMMPAANLLFTPDDHAMLRARFGDGYKAHTI